MYLLTFMNKRERGVKEREDLHPLLGDSCASVNQNGLNWYRRGFFRDEKRKKS